MGLYQGRALRQGPVRQRPTRGRRLVRILQMLGVIAVATGIAHLPWDAWRGRYLVVDDVRVDGAEYLDPARIAALAGVKRGADLVALDLALGRQRLMAHARIEQADLRRHGLRGVAIRVSERRPVMLVRHGAPWEMDSAGVLLAPLTAGAVADVPLLSGVDLEKYPEGTLVRTEAVRRGLEWVRALSSRELQLGGRVSEIDVSEDRSTALLLMSGTRVLCSAWPPGVRTLSGLRTVLADLEKRGTLAREVDVRFDDQVIVRPAEPADPAAAVVARSS